MNKRLLIQMCYDASTNKYPISFPLPMLLLNIKQENDDLLDLILETRDMVKEAKLTRLAKLVDDINNRLHTYDEIIVNMGEYPADADRYFYFEFFLGLLTKPVSIMGTYAEINGERALQFNNIIKGNIVNVLKTDFDIRTTFIPDYYLENYPKIGTKTRAVMKITWGCPQRCKMCPVPVMYDGKYKYDKVNDIVDRIVKLYERGVRFITFVDDNISTSDKRFVQVFKKVKSLNLKGLRYHSQEGFEVTAFANEEFCEIVSENTWEQVKLGVENIKADFLKKIGKYYFDPNDIDIALKNIVKYNIKNVRFFYLLGLDETEEDVLDNLRYFSKHHVQLRTNIIRKYAGTKLNEMSWETNMSDHVMKRLKAMSYAISWLSFYKVDLFEGNSFDKFITENGYTKTIKDDVVYVTGRTKFGFQTGRFKLAMKYMYENQHNLTDMIVNINDEGILTLTNPPKKVESKWF